MNSRVKDLMLRAGYDIPELAELGHKLAELIIKENLKLVTDCYQYNKNTEAWDNALRFVEKKIKDHYGLDK